MRLIQGYDCAFKKCDHLLPMVTENTGDVFPLTKSEMQL